MCMAVVTEYWHLLIVRLLLGIAEAGCGRGGGGHCQVFAHFIRRFYPGVIFFLTFWYKKSEQGLRIALFTSSAALAGAFGGLLAYAILQMDAAPYEPWQWLFLIEGSCPFFCLFCSRILKASPRSSRAWSRGLRCRICPRTPCG